MHLLISIVGPTAVGKTALAVQVARHFGTGILSADSRQVYLGMDIGTNKASPSEISVAPHWLIDFISPDENLGAGKWADLAVETLNQEFLRNPVALACGGSGFYLDALWFGLDEFPPIPADIRETLMAELSAKGLPALVEELRVADPITFASIDRRNPVRVVRALEIFRGTGAPISSFRQGKKEIRPWRNLKFLVDLPRETLYERIDARVKAMVDAGLVEEVQKIVEMFGMNAPGLQSVGYAEFLPFLLGEYGLDEAIRLAQRNTRHLAKRQGTWFRRYNDLQVIRPEDGQKVIELAEKELGRD